MKFCATRVPGDFINSKLDNLYCTWSDFCGFSPTCFIEVETHTVLPHRQQTLGVPSPVGATIFFFPTAIGSGGIII